LNLSANLVIYITDSLPASGAKAGEPILALRESRRFRGISMPLTPFLKGASFDPQAIEAMTAAFEAVCRSLQLVDRTDPLTEIVARKVIEVGGRGERDPEQIRELVLLALDESGQRSA